MVASIIFYIVAALIIFTALNMVLSKNLVHSALFMAATFMLIAVIYVLLNADYLAVVQVMIYVGAISILLVFGVMLTKRTYMDDSSRLNRYSKYAAVVAVLIFAVFVRTIMVTSFVPSGGKAAESTIAAISTLLLNDYSIAFEVSGFLLLAATIGAIVIGKGVKETK
ncbi:NADH-quinone oxidoreductase subunit J family protein [Candidatus Clostridium stratigraminis]|uniref:NADH-quinone oxidoreductase subunit J n=1 Tax=Candidatus Clostridium stratigraminis TaxID=3381661 RepID=A0ABW8T0D0_9CLOT